VPTGGRPDDGRPLLSARESEILRCLADGMASKQVAEALGMSVRTVETHRQNIRRKLGLAGQAELIKYAVERCRGPA
jgi:DNA-binding CsgD family transcriptional regulator